ncbi:hypothetical protein R3W88_029593 [Solanum pinnatisectum]|uniref:Uncharacterized protein n=1 Tax=Solanum pinnatisectum TaxID=50273 RepID=A0AAV9K5T9_9SOLN|nr:hypothetical protein R3W88_029593 [Solanum pinnatisectum]
MHSFRSCTLCRLAKHRLDKRYTSHQPTLDEKKEKQVHPYKFCYLERVVSC